jgi:hypothetical protein
MRLLVSAALITVLASYSSAYALSVTNRDGTDQKITITEDKKQREETIGPSKTLANFCLAGCVIQLQNGEEYEFDGNEIVSIEEGLMFLDEPSQEDAGETAGQKPSGGPASGQTPPGPSSGQAQAPRNPQPQNPQPQNPQPQTSAPAAQTPQK